MARLRRCAMAALLGMEKAGDGPFMPPLPYLRVLGAGPLGMELLARAGKAAALPVSPSLAVLEKAGDGAARCARLSARAADLYALLLKTPGAGGEAYTRPFVRA